MARLPPSEYSESRPRATPREAEGGYECEFVEPPPKQLQSECPICRVVLREPHILSCCGHNFCETCIGYIQRDGKPCPLCNEPGFSTMANKGLKRALNEFQVRCPHRELGCKWVDELGKLNQHLNADPQPERQLEGCQFISVECIHCKDHMRRHVIAGHQNEHCPKRPYTCEYCKEYESTFEDVVDHWAECKCYPLPCPNNCSSSGSGIKRQNLERHVEEECTLAVVECDFHYAGCGVKRPRKDMAVHMKEESVAHISLLAAENQRLAKQLLERDEKMQQLMQHNTELSRRIDQQERTCQELKVTHTLLPIDIQMTGFKELKDTGTTWCSPPFYTHLCGYKMCLSVCPKGSGIGTNTHVSVFTHHMCGEFDSHLKWPFQGEITVQLLNRSKDCRHHTMVIPYTDTRSAGRVTTGTRSEGLGFPTFISFLQLYGNSDENCRYLTNNSLIFRVLSVKIIS